MSQPAIAVDQREEQREGNRGRTARGLVRTEEEEEQGVVEFSKGNRKGNKKSYSSLVLFEFVLIIISNC